MPGRYRGMEYAWAMSGYMSNRSLALVFCDSVHFSRDLKRRYRLRKRSCLRVSPLERSSGLYSFPESFAPEPDPQLLDRVKSQLLYVETVDDFHRVRERKPAYPPHRPSHVKGHFHDMLTHSHRDTLQGLKNGPGVRVQIYLLKKRQTLSSAVSHLPSENTCYLRSFLSSCLSTGGA